MVTTPVAPHGIPALLETIERAASTHLDLLQVRQPDLEGGALLALVRECVARVRRRGTRVIVNERLDVALAGGAHGVHLRSDSLPAARARTAAPPGFLIGRSVHSVEEASAATTAGGLDYLIFGTTFSTASKPGRAPAGLDSLAAVAASTPLPVLAVGGITRERIDEVMKTGAAGYAAIGLFAGS